MGDGCMQTCRRVGTATVKALAACSAVATWIMGSMGGTGEDKSVRTRVLGKGIEHVIRHCLLDTQHVHIVPAATVDTQANEQGTVGAKKGERTPPP